MATTRAGESKVDVGHLIRLIIPKQYRFDIRIASFVELVANALDASRLDLHPHLRMSDASSIEISINAESGILEIVDYGIGMDKEELEHYHDIESAKVTGQEIGFAGQGAKLALNFCSKVITETVSPCYKGYSEWHLEDKSAPYRIVDNKTLSLEHRGTKVILFLNDEAKTFYTPELLERTLKEHYYPLLDKKLLRVYTGELPILVDDRSSLRTHRQIYDKNLKFIVNRKQIVQEALQKLEIKWISITTYRKAKANGFFGLSTNTIIEELLQGIAICSFGKVIERTWFRKEPREKQRIAGWIEAPYLIEAVTTDKCGFQKGNKTWEGFFRKAQTKFSEWLEEEGLLERAAERKADFSGLERQINSILKNLPELPIFGSRTPRNVAILDQNGEQRETGSGTQKVEGTKGGQTIGEGIAVYPGDEDGRAPTTKLGPGPAATDHQRTIRGGIQLQFDDRVDKEEEAWFDGNVVCLNKAHPAYKKADREKLLDYHVLKSVALSLVEFYLGDREASCKEALRLTQKFFRLWGEQ